MGGVLGGGVRFVDDPLSFYLTSHVTKRKLLSLFKRDLARTSLPLIGSASSCNAGRVIILQGQAPRGACRLRGTPLPEHSSSSTASSAWEYNGRSRGSDGTGWCTAGAAKTWYVKEIVAYSPLRREGGGRKAIILYETSSYRCMYYHACVMYWF